MSTKEESKKRIDRRKNIETRILSIRPRRIMPACDRCKTQNFECVVAPEVNEACARCIGLGREKSCNVFMSYNECKCRC